MTPLTKWFVFHHDGETVCHWVINLVAGVEYFEAETGEAAIEAAALIQSSNGEYIAVPTSEVVVAKDVEIVRRVQINQTEKGRVGHATAP